VTCQVLFFCGLRKANANFRELSMRNAGTKNASVYWSKDKPPPGRGLNRALSGIRAAFAPFAILGLLGFTPNFF
jgi:hypothetical protein